jgi:hypothetical protein
MIGIVNIDFHARLYLTCVILKLQHFENKTHYITSDYFTNRSAMFINISSSKEHQGGGESGTRQFLETFAL